MYVLEESRQEEEPEREAELRSLARCAEPNTDWTTVFFSEDLCDIARAKHLCTGCPVQAPCLEAATERREPFGVWGGELFAHGHVVVQKRRRGRPPKSRPAEVIWIDGEEVVVVPAVVQSAS
ncbi:MAG TPA: WhiB family transcriptional regulator [Acidimicrobiales bacterium]|jgi:WhiB family redox-sensing transcriptional regulator